MKYESEIVSFMKVSGWVGNRYHISSSGVRQCSECGGEFVGVGFPIANVSDPNCGNCYGYINGVYTPELGEI